MSHESDELLEVTENHLRCKSRSPNISKMMIDIEALLLHTKKVVRSPSNRAIFDDLDWPSTSFTYRKPF